MAEADGKGPAQPEERRSRPAWASTSCRQPETLLLFSRLLLLQQQTPQVSSHIHTPHAVTLEHVLPNTLKETGTRSALPTEPFIKG